MPRSILPTVTVAATVAALLLQARAEAQTVAENANQLEEVVVTAQKRSERLQDVPLAVSAVGQDEIQGLSAKTLSDVARTVPGLVLVNNGISDVPTIRGVYSTVGAATVGYYIDDTPVQVQPGFVGNADLELFDLERVEVLRGPQGTLYGGSAMGGMIRFITPQPSLQGTSGKIRAEVSATDSGNPNYEVGGALGTPVIENVLGFRGSVYFREDGGYIDRLSRTSGDVVDSNVNNSNTAQVRAALLWQPTDALGVSPAFLYQTQHNDDLPMFQAGLAPLQQNFVISQPGHDTFYLPSLTLNYTIGGMTLTAVTSYFDRDERQVFDYSTLVPELLTGQPVVPGFTNFVSIANRSNEQQNISQEIRLASASGGRLEWLAGAFFARQRQVLNFPLYEPQFSSLVESVYGAPPAALGLEPLPGSIDFYTNTATIEKDLAAFGEVTYHLLDNFKITGGLRVSRSQLDYDRIANGPLNGGLSTAAGEQQATPVTPKAALAYDIDPDTLLYASAAKGFRVGGVNNEIPVSQCAGDLANATGGLAPDATFKPDSLWEYELGLKSQWLERRLVIDASVFRINWSNMQQSVSLPDCGFGYVANLGSARSQGVELEMAATPVQGLKLSTDIAYTDARLSSSVFGAVSPVTGQQAVFGLDGDRMPGVPLWTGSASAEYHFRVSADFSPYIRGDYQYVGQRYRTAPQGRVGYDAAIYNAPSYGYGSARCGALWGDWDVALFVNNIANSRPIIGAYTDLEPVTDTPRETTLRPRIIGISLQRQF